VKVSAGAYHHGLVPSCLKQPRSTNDHVDIDDQFIAVTCSFVREQRSLPDHVCLEVRFQQTVQLQRSYTAATRPSPSLYCVVKASLYPCADNSKAFPSCLHLLLPLVGVVLQLARLHSRPEQD
jgi:hypothetical protein